MEETTWDVAGPDRVNDGGHGERCTVVSSSALRRAPPLRPWRPDGVRSTAEGAKEPEGCSVRSWSMSTKRTKNFPDRQSTVDFRPRSYGPGLV
jgi:hypothetical protein